MRHATGTFEVKITPEAQGTLSIEIKDGKHLYDLAYRLPPER